MFLRRLRLSNIRSIPELTLSFAGASGGGRAWTYILGENGTGKSSLLRAIALILAGGDAVPELVSEPDDWIRLGQDEAFIELEFATADEESRQAKLTFQRGASMLQFLSANRETLTQLDAAIAKASRNYFVVGYGVSRRISAERGSVRSALTTYRSPRARAVATLFDPEAPLVSLEQWAMDLEYRRGKDGLKAVRIALDTLLPDVRFQGIDRERRRLMFQTPEGTLPLTALSDGYQAMAAWCGDLLFQITEAFEDYRDPLKARGLLLIDEIDLHLHPLWQRQLVLFLQQTLPRMQVVATTHSPLTVHQAQEGELFFLRRDNGPGVRLVAFEGAPRTLMLHQLLQSPAFGLETLDSPQIASLREEARQLRNAKGAAEQRRLKQIADALADVPNWEEVPPYLQRSNAVLERLATRLGVDPDTPIPAKGDNGRARRTARRE